MEPETTNKSSNHSVGGNEVTKSITLEGQTYKIGLHGKVFTWRYPDGWVRSTNYSPEQIQDKLRNRLRK